MSGKGIVAVVLSAVLLASSPALAAGSFGDWAAVVVAGDWHAHSGEPSEVFDNARRDVSLALQRIGFSPVNIAQFSVRPGRYPGQHPLQATAGSIATALWDLSNRTSGGCLAYFTSHGSPDGLVLDEDILPPDKMARIIDNACAGRPTVVIVSACYSGVFIPALKAPNRMVLTAARPDRTSFGCGQSDKYTFFDNCVLQSIIPARDFPDLAAKVDDCVAAREKKEKVYPSEPQLALGTSLAARLPRW